MWQLIYPEGRHCLRSRQMDESQMWHIFTMCDTGSWHIIKIWLGIIYCFWVLSRESHHAMDLSVTTLRSSLNHTIFLLSCNYKKILCLMLIVNFSGQKWEYSSENATQGRVHWLFLITSMAIDPGPSAGWCISHNRHRPALWVGPVAGKARKHQK